MAHLKQQPKNVPEVPDEAPGSPRDQRRRTIWLVVLCVVLIIVTTLLVVNELTSGPGR